MVLNELSFAIDKELYCRVYNDFSDEAYDTFGEFIKCLGNSTVEKIYGIQNNGLAIRISGELTNYFRMKKLIPYNVYDDNTHTSIPCGTKYNITKVYKYPESQDFAFDISTSYGTKRISGFYNQEEAEKEGWVFSSHKQSLKSSTVYSDSFNDMIQKDFTYKGNKYTWNDSDCVYYNDNGDEDDFFMEIPEGAITSSKAIKSSQDKTDPETEIRTLWKNASKQSKVKIMKDNGWNQYIEDRQHWSVTLNTEDEYEADNFRNAIDDLWNEDSGEYSYDDIQGMGDVHLGVERYGDFSEMCGNDTYEDLDPRIRDKYVVYCEPSSTYRHRREMDW